MFNSIQTIQSFNSIQRCVGFRQPGEERSQVRCGGVERVLEGEGDCAKKLFLGLRDAGGGRGGELGHGLGDITDSGVGVGGFMRSHSARSCSGVR